MENTEHKLFYKTKITQGCTAFDFEVDGKSWNCENPSFEFEQKEQFKKDLGAYITKLMLEDQISVQSVVELIDADEYDSDENSCEQCGDTVSWEIRDIQKQLSN